MNKQNKILLGILAFVVACTIGYALFSETITVNGTATAEGDFGISATCTKGLNASMKSAYQAMGGEDMLNEEGYSDDTCTVVDNTITYTSKLAYPTAARWFTVKYTNTGSITAKLYANDESSATFAGSIKFYKNDTNELLYTDTVNMQSFTAPLIGVAFEKSDGTLIDSSNESEYNEFMDVDNQIVTLKSGESAYVLIYTTWPDNDVYQRDDTYYITQSNVTTTWKQVTAD